MVCARSSPVRRPAWGRRPRPFWPRAARASSSTIPPARRKPKRPPISAAAPAPKCVVVQGDVSRDEDCKKIVAAAAPWGRLDVLVNNAGTTKHVPHARSRRAVGGGFSAHLCRQHHRPVPDDPRGARLLEAGAKASGRASAVVNVSSVAGISGGGSSVAYAASKGALNTMTQSLARALAPLIRVNTVCPGYIDTPWFTKGRGEAGAKAGARQRGGEGAAEGRLNGRRHRAAGVLPRLAGIEQHDRRIRAHGCGDASGYVIGRVIPGWCVSTQPPMRNCASGNLRFRVRCLRIAPE